ncbi:splicesome-associated protein [Zopfia rhizophila CBS 207.26]|uniref:Splicesome-associated protein n=1 Tax=Zopfia rhizophila CBS 207.26 TaxID=1314779 RepID=A0A6A6DED1_9PEZI|nr:splicesome-associated protein [Zopfia rhizophila CBS 207.26]
MLLEEQRLLHEDLERLEQAVAERVLEDPKHIRERLTRDHQAASFLKHIEDQSSRLLDIYRDANGDKEREVHSLSSGDPFESFFKQVKEIDHFHKRYPNEPVENLEKAYKQRTPEEKAALIAQTDAMFTGEEGSGRYFDMIMLHEQYLNLPHLQGARRVTYLQYLHTFDTFTYPDCSLTREQKISDAYFQYLKALADYLESFMRRTKPLENLDKLFANFDKEFDEAWERGEVPGWELNTPQLAPETSQAEGSGEGIWCSACKKGFSKETVYEAHLKGKKHIKNVEAQQAANESDKVASTANVDSDSIERFKQRAVAEKEFRIRKLAAAMQTERSDTKVNVERKQGMTDRERQQELEMLYAETTEQVSGDKDKDDADSDGEDKIYNPLKLPLAWDGKPIPFWLYKLHGLGVEFPCEICGNYVYMGRRAFDKHFNEPRHVFGLKCLGIQQNVNLFREITGIKEANELWAKLQKDKKKEKAEQDNIIEMEDNEGNVMPEKIWHDLRAQGLV